MNIYNNTFVEYNNLATLSLIVYSGTVQLSNDTLRTIIMAISFVCWIVFCDKSEKEYYKLLDCVAKGNRIKED